jgi:hypothetical protein
MQLYAGLKARTTRANGWMHQSWNRSQQHVLDKMLAPVSVMHPARLPKHHRCDLFIYVAVATNGGIWWGFLPPKLRETRPACAGLIFSAWLSGDRNLLQSQHGFSSRSREIGRAWNPGSSYPLTI